MVLNGRKALLVRYTLNKAQETEARIFWTKISQWEATRFKFDPNMPNLIALVEFCIKNYEVKEQ